MNFLDLPNDIHNATFSFLISFDLKILLFVCKKTNDLIIILTKIKKIELPSNYRMCSFSAKFGYFNILKWAREFGWRWTDTCAGAASRGHLEILKWSRENGCNWLSFTFHKICAKHSLVFQWAKENGSPWTYEFDIYEIKNNSINQS